MAAPEARTYVLAPKLASTLLCGENARAGGVLGRIQAVRPYDALSDAEKRDVVGPRGDEMVQLQLYELRTASRDGIKRLDLTRRFRWVAAAAIESTILVAHDAHTRDGTVPLPLEGVAGAYVIDRVERRPVAAKNWKSIPGPRTADDLDWRLELRRIIYGLLAEDIHVVGTSGVGYSAASLSCSENDWAVIQQIFMDSAAGGEAPRVRKGRGETRSWSLNPTNVMFTRSSCATRRITLEFVTPDQLERVGTCIGAMWNVATCRRTLDSQKRIEIGLEDPLQPDDADACASFTLHAIVASGDADELEEESESEDDVQAPADEQPDDRRKRPRPSVDPKRPSDAVFGWRGKYFDDDSGKDGAIEVWRVDDVRYDEELKDWVVMSERVDPPPPKGEAAKDADDSWWNWGEIRRFRNTFSGRLRKRATKHARAPRVPGLRLRFVSAARGRGTLTVGAFWRAMPVRDLGGRNLSKL